jgi:hypothetical protein
MKPLKKGKQIRVLAKHLGQIKEGLREFRAPKHKQLNNCYDYTIESIKAICCGAGSLLGIDRFSRRVEILNKRFSDSTLHQMLKEPHLYSIQRRVLDNLRVETISGLLTPLHNKEVKEMKVRHVDGSTFLKHHTVYMAGSGFLDGTGYVTGFNRFKVVTSQGKELEGFDAVIEAEIRALHNDPSPCLFTVDGKMFCYERLNRIKEARRDLLVRIRRDDDRQLELIETAKRMFENETRYVKQGVRHSKFQDAWGDEVTVDRALLTHPQLRVNGAEYPVVVAYIERKKTEHSLRKEWRDAEEEHRASGWIICSATFLDEVDLYLLKKRHWEVETLFRILKQEFWSGNAHCEDAEKLQRLLTLILTAMLLVALVREELLNRAKNRTECVETTYKLVIQMLAHGKELFEPEAGVA